MPQKGLSIGENTDGFFPAGPGAEIRQACVQEGFAAERMHESLEPSLLFKLEKSNSKFF
jgi:hypothetical protein